MRLKSNICSANIQMISCGYLQVIPEPTYNVLLQQKGYDTRRLAFRPHGPVAPYRVAIEYCFVVTRRVVRPSMLTPSMPRYSRRSARRFEQGGKSCRLDIFPFDTRGQNALKGKKTAFPAICRLKKAFPQKFHQKEMRKFAPKTHLV